MQQRLPLLKPGDLVEIIAPGSRCKESQLTTIKELLLSWQLNCRLAQDIFGNDLLCANTDTNRFNALQKALHNPEIKGIICARGGYGSMKLIPRLINIPPPSHPKLFLGMSDITALNIFLQQHWRWPILHGSLASYKFSAESIQAVKSILFGETQSIKFIGHPLNSFAEKRDTIHATITGGNLCVIQAGIGTIWQLNARNKIILLEDIGERGYRVDRMLEHLQQANILNDAAAILFGDFTEGYEADGSSLLKPVLLRFAENAKIPVVEINGIGHGHTNFPIPLGTAATLGLGKEINLSCSI